MKTINESVRNAFKRPTTQRKGRILVNGEYYDVYNVEYYADCYDEGKVIGNAIASQLDFDIPYMPKFDTFQYFDAIMVGNDYEYIDFGTFTVFDEQDQDEFNKHITAFDNLIKFNKPFVGNGSYPKTLYEELSNVCNQAEVVLANDSIPNGNFIVENNQFVDGESLKTVLKQICGISGTYGIVKNNALYLQLKNITNEVIDKSQHDPVDWKRRSYGINQVIIGDSQIEGEYVIRQDDADIALNGVHKLEILDNLFANTQAKRSALIDELYNQVHGFGYIPFETKGEWLSYLEIGDTINIDGIDTILLRINAKSPQALETTMSAPAIIDSSIEYVDNTADVDNRLKLTEIKVDKQNQEISAVVSQTIDPNNPNSMYNTVTQLNIRVGVLEGTVSDIADITVSAEDTDGQVELNNVNESEPIQIKIKPTGVNIGYLYPNNGLFPSSNLFLKRRTLKFTRTYEEEGETKTEEIYYELPDDLLYYNEEIFDEFYLDYDSRTCQITKRCEYNADGTISPLANEQIVPYEYPTINLGSGNYTVCLLGYSSAYLMVRLMASNIYTTQFATKVEMHSAISATAQEINAEVGRKVGTDEIIAKINLTPETATIQASKINIAGTITAINNNTTTTINGNKITTGSITATQISSETITADKIASNAITADKIASNSITADKIQAGAITASKVSSDIITTDNFSAQNISANKITTGSINASNGITIGGFTIGNYSFYGGTTNGTMTIQRGSSASIDFPANGGRLMLGSTASNGVALTTANKLVISDQYGQTTPSDANSQIEIRSLNGNVRIATNGTIKLVGSISINGYTGQTIDRIIYKDSDGNNKYLIFQRGILVGYN